VPAAVAAVLMEGLFTTITNVNFNDATLAEQIAKTKLPLREL
jgi:hydroxylamine reductase (hybrid-cluster protein)